MTGVRIPFLSLVPGDDAADIRAAIDRVIARGWFVLGPEVDAFEREFAAASGAAHAIGVGNGTDAIALILRALGIGAGDEVITTPLSAAYSAIAVLMAGARPVFADIDPIRMTIDPDRIADAVTSRTRAILPVHLYGQPADMAAIAAVARRHGLAIVEDCCQAHLATTTVQPVARDPKGNPQPKASADTRTGEMAGRRAAWLLPVPCGAHKQPGATELPLSGRTALASCFAPTRPARRDQLETPEHPVRPVAPASPGPPSLA